jgi:hypothetical protein
MSTAANERGPAATLSPETREFYQRSLRELDRAGVPFLLGGAYALFQYTGVERHTKDCDIFLKPEDFDAAAEVLQKAGLRTEITCAHWLGKAFNGDDFVDLIFGSGNGVFTVDDEWFTHATDAEVFEVPVKVMPPEELIWSKAFIMERERFDGADVAHVFHALAEKLDWGRLLRRFQEDHRVLFTHLVLFGFIYPGERHRVPAEVMRKLAARLEEEVEAGGTGEKVCKGTFLSREQYLVDIGARGYADARVPPWGPLSQKDVDHWTASIFKAPTKAA